MKLSGRLVVVSVSDSLTMPVPMLARTGPTSIPAAAGSWAAWAASGVVTWVATIVPAAVAATASAASARVRNPVRVCRACPARARLVPIDHSPQVPCFAVVPVGCPVQFFHNLDDTQPTTRLLKNATRFSRLSSWLTLQTNSQDSFPQDSAVLPTGINSDCYDESRHFVIFNGWQQITLRNYTELDTLQKIGTTRPFIPPTRHSDAARPPDATRHPATSRPPFTAPPEKSHVIRLPENSTPPTNVAIPTVWFQSLKGLHGITCDISGQPSPTVPAHARTRQHDNAPTQLRTTEPQGARHRAPASSRASTHTPAQ